MKKLTPKQAKKVRLILLLLIFAGGLTGLFFAVSGIGNSITSKHNASDTTKQAFNSKLPEANLPSTSAKNKLEAYMEAQKDSLKLQELQKKDPYSQNNSYDPAPPDKTTTPSSANKSPKSPRKSLDNNEIRVNDKLTELSNILNQAQQANQHNETNQTSTPIYNSNSSHHEEIDRLEKLMAQTQSKDSTEDPEMRQINTMLDKLIAIQHPDQLTATSQSPQENKPHYEVTTATSTGDTSLTYNIPVNDDNTNGFYGLGTSSDTARPDESSFTAVVHQNQTLVNGSTIKMRLTQDIYIKGKIIPKNTFVYGSCSISDERLHINITTILTQNIIYPVKLAVYDTDGQEGIFVPGAISRDAAKENADRAIQSIGMTNFDQSLSAQAAQTGIETAKTFLSRKVKLITVTIKAGHSILLRNTSNH